MKEEYSEIPESLRKAYSFRKLLGRGGMSTVWSVNEKGKKKISYALKIVKKEVARDPCFIARFTREVEISKRLNHQGLPKIYASGIAEERPYILMEELEGETLSSLLARKRPLPTEMIESIGLELSEILANVHRQGIVHRDVKPGNVIIPNKGSLKLLDLGISRAVQGDTVTRTGTIVGTPFYLAPECCRGERARSCSDIFSLGVLLLDCYFEEGIFENSSIVEVLSNRAKGTERLPIFRVKSERDRETLAQLLRHDPEKRIQNGDEAKLAILEAPALSQNQRETPTPFRRLFPLLCLLLCSALLCYDYFIDERVKTSKSAA